MKLRFKFASLAIGAGLLSSMTALAGTYTNDFSQYSGFAPAGSMFIDTNRAILTINASVTGGQGGSITLWDDDAGQAIESLDAVFKIQIGPGSGNPADGVAFNFGPNVYEGLVTSEEGPGGEALTISFDTYDNGPSEGVPTPSVDIKFGGRVIAGHAYTKPQMVTSQLEDVRVQLNRAGKVSVWYKGQLIHDNVFVQGWTPTSGRFNFSGRCGGEYAYQAIAGLGISTVLQGAAVIPTVTTSPLSATVNEGGSTNFSVVVDGTAPFTFQWYKNNAPIQDATNVTLALGPVHYTDNNANVKCTVTNPAGDATSSQATLTVIRDTIAPTVVRAAANQSGTQVTVTYSEPVSDSALLPSNYSIDQGIGLPSTVTRVDASRVALTTGTLPGGRAFVLTINNVQDTATSPANTIAPNTHVSFNSFLFQLGSVIHKKYVNFADGLGFDVNNLFNDPRYPNFPDRQEIMGMFEYPAAGLYRDQNTEPDGNTIPPRGYFDTLEGFFIPATSGDYVFYATGGDLNQVFLSTDSDPINKHLICNLGGWTNPRDWNIAQGNNPDDAATRTNGLRSDYYTGTAWPTPDPVKGGALISLTAGQRYYILGIHHDFTWSGADDFAVTFTLNNVAVPAAGSAPALAGSVVGTYLDPTGASVSFVLQPTNTTILQGRKATFYARAAGQSAYGTNVTYQWQTAPSGSSTFTDIPGAASANYTTPVLGTADTGRKYQLLASVPGLSQLSSVATVAVNADTIAPHLVAASGIPSRSGATFDVGVTFDEPLNQASAETFGHYTIPGGTVSAAKYFAGSPGVILTVSGLAAGSSYTVNVTGVADPYGNTMSASSLPLTVSTMHWGVVGADELQLGNGVLPVGPGNFDVYSDGIGEWATYDETTFVYEQVTGDFDREVRVEYQDSSSQWARAGLIARDVTNFGVDRTTQSTAAGRYQKIHVNPVQTAMGTAGNNLYEGNRRLQTGAQTDNIPITPNSNPKYPNAWARLKRTGQTFAVYRSDDGVNWVSMGSTTFPAPGMPSTVYVGPEYTPENGNVDVGLRTAFLAKFRDYRTHAPALSYQRTPSGMTITFDGTLQSANSLNGPWTDMTGTPSPYIVPITGTQTFFRAKQ